MIASRTAVYGVYRDRDHAERAVDAMRAAGFRAADISILHPDGSGTSEGVTKESNKGPEGATAGAATGSILGGTLGWLAGIGALAIPGIGPFIAAGPIMGALAGIGLGGTVGSLVGGLVGLGIPEYEAKHYENRLRTGATLISLHCDTLQEITLARSILDQTGAEDVASANESHTGLEPIRHDRSRVGDRYY